MTKVTSLQDGGGTNGTADRSGGKARTLLSADESCRIHEIPWITKPALEGEAMGVTIFLALNAVAVMFLLYALAHFWQEGQRRNHRDDAMSQKYAERERGNVTVVTRRIYNGPRRGAIIRFSAGNAGSNRKFGGASGPAGDMEWPATKISTR